MEINYTLCEVETLSDCKEVMSCFIAAFGNTYIKREIYDPEKTLELCEKGKINLYLARSENAEIMGVIGWEQLSMYPATAEICSLVVLPQYRDLKLGFSLIQDMYNILKGMDICSVYSYPIASHLAAQKSIGKLSPVCCGFLPNVFSTRFFDSGIKGHTNPKDSLAVVCFNLKKKDSGRLYLKKEYHDIACTVYSALGTKFTLSEDSLFPKKEKTEYKYRYDNTHETLYININIIGKDFSELVSEITAHSKSSYFAAEICVNMNDESAVYAAEILEESGSLLCGFHPLSKDTEYVIYHYKGAVPFDIDDLCYTEGQKIFADSIRRSLNSSPHPDRKELRLK